MSYSNRNTDTLNDNDRASINLEFQALKDELTRISNATEYNNMNVLMEPINPTTVEVSGAFKLVLIMMLTTNISSA